MAEHVPGDHHLGSPTPSTVRPGTAAEGCGRDTPRRTYPVVLLWDTVHLSHNLTWHSLDDEALDRGGEGMWAASALAVAIGGGTARHWILVILMVNPTPFPKISKHHGAVLLKLKAAGGGGGFSLLKRWVSTLILLYALKSSGVSMTGARTLLSPLIAWLTPHIRTLRIGSLARIASLSGARNASWS